MMNKPSTSPSFILFFSTLIMSTTLIISSTNWLLLWVSMEINLMAMIPLISSSRNSIEAATKYFLVQSVASMILISMVIAYSSSVSQHLSSLLILSSLLLKMGMAPFHFWLPQMTNNMQWSTIFMLITWQKIGPLSILSTILHNWSPTLFTIILLNAFVGATGGLNQSQLRPLIAYSSIAHAAWMITSMIITPSLTLIYFTLYTLLNATMIYPLMLTMKTSTSNFNLTSNASNLTSIWALNALSLAGMPPLLGFFPKWLIILSVMNHSPFIALILITSSMISLYFYLNIFLSALLSSHDKTILQPAPSLLLMLPLITSPIFPISMLS